MNKSHLICGLLLFIFISGSDAQISQGGNPLKSVSGPGEIEWIDLPEVRVDKLLLEDEWNALTGKKSRRIAEEVGVSIDPVRYGTWEELPGGTLIWRLGLRGSGAEALGIVFSRYMLEKGCRIFISDPAEEYVLGAYTSLNNKPGGGLPVSYLPGDELLIQMEVTAAYGGDYGDLEIGSVRWAYQPPMDKTNTGRGSIYALGPCHVDINCPQGNDWQLVKNSVVHLEGVHIYTGVLINNARQDGKAYIFTAAHGVFENNRYNSPVVYFNYENSTCGGNDASKKHSIAGATLVATGDTLENSRDADSLDFALLELSLQPPDSFNIYFAGWSRGSSPALNTTTIHHPNSDAKKISVDNDPPGTDLHEPDYWDYEGWIPHSFWRILEWDLAATELGSSGAPLFNQDQLVIGSLTGGPATCTSPNNDYFTRFDYAWDYYPEPWKQLKHWLDPDNTGILSLDGMDGYPNSGRPELELGDLVLFPNPADEVLMLRAGLAAGKEAEIGIYDLTGKLLLHNLQPWKDGRRIEVQSLPPGIYILRLRQGKRLAAGRFIISR